MVSSLNGRWLRGIDPTVVPNSLFDGIRSVPVDRLDHEVVVPIFSAGDDSRADRHVVS